MGAIISKICDRQGERGDALDVQPKAVARRKCKFFIGANWKCEKQKLPDSDALLAKLNQSWLNNSAKFADIEFCIYPPYVFLDRARQQLISELHVGSQNAWDAAPDNYKSTGVVTADMLHSVGCTWVLLGHSDRRNTLGESDAYISKKVAKCLMSGLSVNITIGETLEAREKGEAIPTLLRQLAAAAAGVPSTAWGRIAIAYEPVWAIGEGATPCSPDECQRVHSALRGWLRENAGEQAAADCRLVYTGSVNEQNAGQYAVLPDVDGFVVGRAGLDVDKLSSICTTLVDSKASSVPRPLTAKRKNKLFIGANWKCSLETAASSDKLICDINDAWLANASSLDALDLCLYPPYLYLDRVRRQLNGGMTVGSQNAFDCVAAFKHTGVVTSDMLHSVGCKWVLLGHSDRRNSLGESDALISEKVAKCLSNDLCVNLTIGETLQARESGEAISTLIGQLGAAAKGVPRDAWSRVAVAYEPVWAIGEGAKPCSPEETQRVHSELRGWVRKNVGADAASDCRFVYTGSVNENNAAQYAQLPDVDGFVVGRAGLDAKKLFSICKTLVDAKSVGS